MSRQSNNKLKVSIKIVPNNDCFNKIKSVTDDFKLLKAPTIINSSGIIINIDYDKYISTLTYKINNAYKIYYGELKAPNNNDITKQVIGRDGCYLYLTTIVNKILFIWHDIDTNMFCFWSDDKYGIMDSIRIINQRIYDKSNNIKDIINNDIDEKLEKLSILHQNNSVYTKVRLCSNYYYIKNINNNNNKNNKNIDNVRYVYTVVGSNLLGKLIGHYTEDNGIPTINLLIDDIKSN
jgi:hypothetical protein